jgi:1,4-dihydroxy-2-naphthoyl-CoA hydrolase
VKSIEFLNGQGRGYMAARLGIIATKAVADPMPSVTVRMKIRRGHLGPHGYLHGGAIIALADTACGYGCWASLPASASGFLTIESKSNHIGASQRGTLECTARARHVGRTTQVWDAEVVDLESSKVIAMFRCTQLVLHFPVGEVRFPAEGRA